MTITLFVIKTSGCKLFSLIRNQFGLQITVNVIPGKAGLTFGYTRQEVPIES